MKFAITLDPSIARRNGWTGTRRREATFADGSKKVLVFSRKPVELDELPDEILLDSKLIVKEIPAAADSPAADYDDGILELADADSAPADEKKGDRVQKSGRFTKGKK